MAKTSETSSLNFALVNHPYDLKPFAESETGLTTPELRQRVRCLHRSSSREGLNLRLVALESLYLPLDLRSDIHDQIRNKVRLDLWSIPMCLRQRLVGGEQADSASGSARPRRHHGALEHKSVVDMAIRKRAQNDLRIQLLDRLCDFPVDEA